MERWRRVGDLRSQVKLGSSTSTTLVRWIWSRTRVRSTGHTRREDNRAGWSEGHRGG